MFIPHSWTNCQPPKRGCPKMDALINLKFDHLGSANDFDNFDLSLILLFYWATTGPLAQLAARRFQHGSSEAPESTGGVMRKAMGPWGSQIWISYPSTPSTPVRIPMVHQCSSSFSITLWKAWSNMGYPEYPWVSHMLRKLRRVMKETQWDNPYTYPTNALTRLESSFKNLIENGFQSRGTTSPANSPILENCSQVGMFPENIPDLFEDMVWLLIMYCRNSMLLSEWFLNGI